MELKILSLDGKEAGSIKLSDAIFALEPRKDLIQRCVNWQLAKRQRGTHKVKFKAPAADAAPAKEAAKAEAAPAAEAPKEGA